MVNALHNFMIILMNCVKLSRSFSVSKSRIIAISSLPVLRGISVRSKAAFKPFSFLKSLAFPRISALSLHAAYSTATIDAKLDVVENFRSDYKACGYMISDTYLSFDLDPIETLVTSINKVTRTGLAHSDLILDGEDLELLYVKVNGQILTDDEIKITPSTLTILGSKLPITDFNLEIQVKISPVKNLALSGLYASGPMLCTQCEAMGFRKIIYSLDRPDILSRYKVRLEGDEAKYPCLLSNGNKIDSGKGSDGKHWAIWEDPFPKPSYLFAVVAGDLGSIHEDFITCRGLRVQLGIYSEKKNVGKLAHAMLSLKKSMVWDEQTFDLPCDLSVYNIVATDDFNMGAMENKGLNVFNSAYVLADPASATDTDYENILGVIGHEYFHNWTGNRVTVRDWFQLTLKEGLTVFRDQWFSSDMGSAAVKRIEDVRGLRGRQFAEDAGPMAHPIRPESYVSMDNFYTATVYVKGAEVVRMYRTLLGEESFKKGMKLYFERHDGTAVTCDDFRAAMADANGVDLTQFERWYSQAGTPVVEASTSYCTETKTFTISLKQHTPSTPGQPSESKLPQVIPIETALFARSDGRQLTQSQLLVLREEEQVFTIEGVSEEPVASLLRGFSAPVRLVYAQSDEELALLMGHDTDSFNRWDAGTRLSTKLILQIAGLPLEEISNMKLPDYYINAVSAVVESAKMPGADPSLVAYALQLPDLTTLGQEVAQIEIDRLHAARETVRKRVGDALRTPLTELYATLSAALQGDYQFNPLDVGRRRLRNTCLSLLADPGLMLTQLSPASSSLCMTDRLAALSCLVSSRSAPEQQKQEQLQTFYDSAAGDALVLNKWFAIQASADLPDQLQRVKKLTEHPDFKLSNPNRARSVLSTFAGNLPHFHARDGEGYVFLADHVIALDALNPQVAARLASAFSQWRRFDLSRQQLMRVQLERIAAAPRLSRDTGEVVARTLR